MGVSFDCHPANHNGGIAQVDDIVMAMDEALRPQACGIVAQLRGAGRSVDFVLEPKKMKWAFKQAERCAVWVINATDPSVTMDIVKCAGY
jgi:histidyl-tRNA synthetase